MISFKTFLQENQIEDEAKDFANKIKKDCAHFLSLRSEPLWRGVKLKYTSSLKKINSGELELYKGTVRTDRLPADSPLWFHEMLDKFLQKEFGTNFRSQSLFCMPTKKGTAMFGRPFAVFPIGKFDYVWSPIIEDATEDFKMTTEGFYPLPEWNGSEKDLEEFALTLADEMSYPEQFKELVKEIGAQAALNRHFYNDGWPIKQRLIQFVLNKRGKELFLFNQGLDQVPPHHEIMIACKNYYAVNEDSLGMVKKYL